MVNLSQSLMMRLTSVSLKRIRGTFFDKVHVNLRAGNGGMGNQKFGGIGGKGGDIYMKGTKVKDLMQFAQKYPERRIKAENGGNSADKRLLGLRGKDTIVEVPCGVRAFTDDKLVIGEVNKIDEQVLLARGGIGGNPATSFSGLRGQRLNVTFELSLISDVSLLGFPNAGKSTLLKACSKAKPKIAAYPFTTIKPNIGILEYEDHRKISMADLPGLIEGAHANFGMGHKFLRHIERANLVLMIVDVTGFQLSLQHPKRSAFETIMLLNKELELYDPSYLEKPMALVVNKMDQPGSEEVLSEIRSRLANIEELNENLPEHLKCEKIVQFEDIIPISAKCDVESVKAVKDYVRLSLENIEEKRRSDTIEVEIKEALERLKPDTGEKGPKLV
ncbi:GTP-binding protein 10-like protein [Frankliniella fusca]|uniref:GTP-binding protein 10-like protein n=1 Tax=Frankliniella fusca TaxID=407009 RepID=A0AAE1H281_9NEOP|nr:GTP-binding protein 10-like protein [Frankliniella fusca]